MKKDEFEALTKYKDMMAFKIVVNKDGKQYIDYYVCWLHNDKVYDARVMPLFYDGYRCMSSCAIKVDNWQEMKQIAKACLCGC